MKRFLMIILILCAIHFWRYHYITQETLKYTDLFSLLFLSFCFITVFHEKGLHFKNAIIFYLIGIICNILSAYINNQQNPFDTFLCFGPYYFILFYFFLYKFNVQRKEIETVIIVFAVLYSVFYLYQEDIFPRRIFLGSIYKNRGTLRIRLEGNGFLMLAYFMLLNRYLLKRKIIHIIIAMFFFVVLLKGGFRTLTAGAILLSGIIFLKLVKYSPTNYLLIIVAVIGLIGILQLGSTSYIFESMIQDTLEQREEGENYIRVLQYDYFTKEYPKNMSYYIFGGGLPGGYGAYAEYMNYLITQFGFYWVDLGLIGFYFVIGGITLCGLLWFTLKAIFIKLPPDSLYLNIYFGYLLIVSYTTMEIYRPGIFVVEAIGLYLIDLARKESAIEINNELIRTL